MSILGTIGGALKSVGSKALPFIKNVGGKIGEYLPNFLTGLGGSAGSIASGLLSFEQQKQLAEQQYGHNLALQKDAQSWQESMSNTAFQRQVKDLRSAGLNPLLATGMSGASTGSVGAGSVGQGSAPSYDIAGSIKTASEVKRINTLRDSELANIKSQTESNSAQAELINEQAETERAKRVQMEFQNAMLDVETHLKRKDLDFYERRFYSELWERMQRAENLRGQTALLGYNAETSRISANAMDLKARTEREIGTFEKQRYMDWKERHPKQEGFLYGLGQYTGTVGNVFRGSASFGKK